MFDLFFAGFSRIFAPFSFFVSWLECFPTNFSGIFLLPGISQGFVSLCLYIFLFFLVFLSGWNVLLIFHIIPIKFWKNSHFTSHSDCWIFKWNCHSGENARYQSLAKTRFSKFHPMMSSAPIGTSFQNYQVLRTIKGPSKIVWNFKMKRIHTDHCKCRIQTKLTACG